MKAGDSVKGKVQRTTPYGAFLDLEDGTSALLHVNQMRNESGIVDPQPRNLVTEGEELEVRKLETHLETPLQILLFQHGYSTGKQTDVPVQLKSPGCCACLRLTVTVKLPKGSARRCKDPRVVQPCLCFAARRCASSASRTARSTSRS